jgi:hypothetical protein
MCDDREIKFLLSNHKVVVGFPKLFQHLRFLCLSLNPDGVYLLRFIELLWRLDSFTITFADASPWQILERFFDVLAPPPFFILRISLVLLKDRSLDLLLLLLNIRKVFVVNDFVQFTILFSSIHSDALQYLDIFDNSTLEHFLFDIFVWDHRDEKVDWKD